MGVEDLLVCSLCQGPVWPSEMRTEGTGSCGDCQQTYRYEGGVYDMTPVPAPDPDVKEMWPVWEQLQANAVVAYDADPRSNLSVGRRRDARLFAEFSELHGLVLDIGCGPQAAPSYGLNFDGRLVGIDPLVGVQPRRFDFVQGVGEYLPFADGTFDRILFATSLDHMLVPIRVLREARRVVKPSGTVNLWFLEHGHGPADESISAWRRRAHTARTMLRQRDFAGIARRSAMTVGLLKKTGPPSYMSSLPVPAGAEDHFHAFHLDRPLVLDWLGEAGLLFAHSSADRDLGEFIASTPVAATRR